MDMLLIDPPWVIEDDANLWKRVGSCLPSLGLAYVAAYLEQHGYEAAIIDCTAERIPVARVTERLAEFRLNPPRFVGLTATTPLIDNALAIAAVSRQVFPDAKIVLGGVHPTVEPDSTLGSDCVDYVVRDEGELTALELVSGRAIDEIDGLSFRSDGRTLHNPDRALISDLDAMPPPAYHLLPMTRYFPALGSYRQLPAMSVFATRGCPGRCTFCHRTFRGKVRHRSAASVVKEIRMLKNDYGIREIAFYDDTFTLSGRMVRELCDMLIRDRLGVTWSCFTRADRVDEELLRRMKDAGCHLLLIGVESADETILKNLKKNVSLEQARDVVRTARSVGIETRASFLLGSPGETEETIRKTIDFAITLDPDQVQFNITTAYPGTELYEWAKNNGYLCCNDWSRYNMSDINMRLPSVDHETLRNYYRESHRRFYFRARVICRRLARIRSATQLLQEIKGGWALLNIFTARKWRRRVQPLGT